MQRNYKPATFYWEIGFPPGNPSSLHPSNIVMLFHSTLAPPGPLQHAIIPMKSLLSDLRKRALSSLTVGPNQLTSRITSSPRYTLRYPLVYATVNRFESSGKRLVRDLESAE